MFEIFSILSWHLLGRFEKVTSSSSSRTTSSSDRALSLRRTTPAHRRQYRRFEDVYTSHRIQWLPGKHYILWWRSTIGKTAAAFEYIGTHIEIIGVSVRDIKNYTRFVMGNIIIVIQFSRPEVRRRDSRIMSVAEPPWGSASPRCTRDVGFLVRKCTGIYL